MCQIFILYSFLTDLLNTFKNSVIQLSGTQSSELVELKIIHMAIFSFISNPIEHTIQNELFQTSFRDFKLASRQSVIA